MNEEKALLLGRPEDENIRFRLRIVLGISIVFLVIGSVGGWWSNSLAVLTDAANTFVDASGFLLALLSIHLAKQKPSSRFSFGYDRAEVLSALVNVLTLWLINGILVRLAFDRVVYRHFKINSSEMIFVATIGIVLDSIMFLVLHGDSLVRLIVNCFSTKRTTVSFNFSNNINLRAVTIHIVGDLLQGLGDLLAGILIFVEPNYRIADPICTFVFSAIAVATTFPLVRDLVCILMEGVPTHLSFQKVSEELANLPGVENVHNLRLWSLSPRQVALSVHLSTRHVDHTEVLRAARLLLERNFGITRTAIQVEQLEKEMLDVCLAQT